MRLSQGWPLLGVGALCLGMVGCAGQRDDSLRLSEELGRARANAEWQQARAAEFEARMSRLEQRVAASVSARQPDDRELLHRLDRLIAMNERLVAERSAAALPGSGVASNGPPPAAAVPASSVVPNGTPAARALPPTATTITSDGASSPSASSPSEEQQLRALVERLRGRPGSLHGGLSREQEEALRVLTRPERQLDVANPWQAIY
jgi:hypothetical protein